MNSPPITYNNSNILDLSPKLVKIYDAGAQDVQHKSAGFTNNQYDQIINDTIATERKLRRDYIRRNASEHETVITDAVVGGSIVDSIINNLPFELHTFDEGTDGKIKQANFCGPGTRLEDRLADFDPTTGLHSDFITPPINLLDYGCYKHDLAYSKHADTSRRNVADSKLRDVADFVLKNPESTRTQRVNAAAVKKIMKGKIDHNY